MFTAHVEHRDDLTGLRRADGSGPQPTALGWALRSGSGSAASWMP